ncbi:hypothetical protein JY96_07285 [Aquabacterium sp. NJ1]|uniref:caspase family protein n=1 Tax=Aquabacterium sp. NJ1 TaxID=1538295 RepID=UPI00052BDECF|nr:caspase family protein [Aquabacterium sp. NJ1]KGM39900.1 hypothetical protein JY96_07285 [Aquabacterium sp. NJ1]
MTGVMRMRLVSAAVGMACLLVVPASWADSLDRSQQDDAQAADGLVHCLFPGQVRRLGAFATSVTPRRAARVAPKDCAAGGGEYIEAQDTSSAATKVWLPLAADGVPEAQATVGELYERQGQYGLAKAWYEKAAAQGLARAQFGLAALLDRGLGVPRNAARVTELLTAAGGGAVAGLAYSNRERPQVAFVTPTAAAPLPRPADGRVVVEADAGPATVIARVVAPAGLASVKVNGQAQTPDEQGFLSIPVTVGEGQAEVTVQAQDRDGVVAQAQLAMVQRSAHPEAKAASTDASARTPSAALLKGRRLALVVANQAYQHWPRLDTPMADAQSVSEALHQHFGFDVTLLQNATRQQLLAALSRLRMQAGPEDQVVVYYAGHGQMDPVTARGYWIPVDGDDKDIAQWVSVIDVTDQLAAMQARHVMVIADSCYSGTLTRSLIPQVDQALSAAQRQGPLSHLAKQRVRVAMTSGGLEPVVDGGSVDHSLFARSLLDMLGQVNAPVSAQELFQGVQARFAHLARRLSIAQQPQYAPIGFAGHEAGDFVLAPM